MTPKPIIGVLLLFSLAFLSCQKDKTCGSGCDNRAPVARAGADQVVFLPADSLLLDGSSSTDPDGSIVSYSWSRLSGPAQAFIENASAAKTTVRDLQSGSYQFVLAVKDNAGVFARDTINVTVHPPGTGSHPPIAYAGGNQIISLPRHSVVLSGSGEDPDGSSVSYSWSKAAGPSSFVIVSPGAAATRVDNLVEGAYTFVLTVTDNTGLSATDSMTVTVLRGSGSLPVINVQLVPLGSLSVKRNGVAVAAAGSKILFAGGYLGEQDPLTLFARVDIYDTHTQSWSTAVLSEARAGIGTAVVGTKILFAGGAKTFDYNSGWGNKSTRVDIYDMVTGAWTTTELPVPASFYWGDGAMAAAGGKVFFYSHFDQPDPHTPLVHIYDVASGAWSGTRLSENSIKDWPAAAASGNKVFIAGGYLLFAHQEPYVSPVVDVYDAAANTHTTGSLSIGRSMLRSAAVNNKVLFAGGKLESGPGNFSDLVDIYDGATNSWSLATLSRPTALNGAVAAGQRAFFFGHGWVDVYDAATNAWATASLSVTFTDFAAFVSTENVVYAADQGQVWRVQY